MLHRCQSELMDLCRRHIQGGVSMDQEAVEFLPAWILAEPYFFRSFLRIIASHVVNQRLQRRINFGLDGCPHFFAKRSYQGGIKSGEALRRAVERALLRRLY